MKIGLLSLLGREYASDRRKEVHNDTEPFSIVKLTLDILRGRKNEET